VKSDNDLEQLARELPSSIEAPRDLWAGIEGRIQAKRGSTRVARIGIAGASALLAAACVLLSVRAANHPPVADRTPPITSEPTPVVAPPRASDEPRQDEIAPEEATYLAAVSALEATLVERQKGLPAEDAAHISASLRAIDTAIAVTRGSLLENPDDADLRAELDAEYEQKIDTMNDVLEWTTRS
jgi:hypothetical protein